jgi:hypothetical protein
MGVDVRCISSHTTFPSTLLTMSAPTPFKISISNAKLQRLKQKLALSDFPDEVVDADNPWSRGSPVADIKRLAQYWETEFNWREAEAKLNEFPQFITNLEVDDFGKYDVHFVHQKSTDNPTHAIPLLFLHGWPGSFIEVTKILPEMVKGGVEFPAFNVVAPSLIDFGFSSPSRKVWL